MSNDPNDHQRATLEPEYPAASTAFIDDRWLAAQTKLKPSTFRSQRFKRLHGLAHWFDVDPVYLGSKPRYRLSDALAWLARQGRVTGHRASRQRVSTSDPAAEASVDPGPEAVLP